MDIKQIFDLINFNNNYLVVPGELKSRLVLLKSTIELESSALYKFKLITENELLEQLSFRVNDNILLKELEQQKTPFSITAEKINFARYNLFNPLKELTSFIERNDEYLDFDRTLVNNCQNKIFHFIFEPIYLLPFLSHYKLNYTIHNVAVTNQPLIHQFDDGLSEVMFLFESIANLLSDGVKPEQIYISGLSDINYQTIIKLSRFYNIPIKHKNPIKMLDLKYTKDLINRPFNEILDIINNQDLTDNVAIQIHQAIIDILSKYDYKKYSNTIMDIIYHELKSKSLPNDKINGINVISLATAITLKDSDYLFVLGANYQSFPHLLVDNQYLSDKDKTLILYPTSSDINRYNNNLYAQLIKLPPVKYVSYAAKDSYNEYAPSDVITPYLALNQVRRTKISLDELNKGYAPDLYRFVFSSNDKTNKLLTTFDNSLNLTDKQQKLLAEHILNMKIKLAPSHLSTYLKSPFIYYLRYILKLSNFEDNVATLLGTFFHSFIEAVFRIKFDRKVTHQKGNDFNQPLKALIDSLIVKFNETTSLEEIFDVFYDEYFKLNITDDESLLIKTMFFAKKNRQIFIESTQRLVNLELIQDSIAIYLEQELTHDNFRGYADIVRISKDKKFRVTDYKSSDKSAFSYQKMAKFFADLENDLAVDISLIDLLQLTFYANVLVKDEFGIFGEIGFYTFLEEDAKINGLTIDDFSDEEKPFYKTKDRVISSDELDTLLAKISKLSTDILTKINNASFPNTLIKQVKGQKKLETSQFSIYQALAFYTKYATDETGDGDDEE